MIAVSGNRCSVSGPMVLGLASALLAEGGSALHEAETVFDLAAVTDIDSASLAVVFGWLRLAQSQGKRLRIEHPPAEMLSLAEVYGVAELLPLA